jgi:hypothetical protein
VIAYNYVPLTQDLKTSYKCLISLFSPSNVDIIDSYFYTSFFNVYYTHYVDYMKTSNPKFKIDKCVIQEWLHL